MKTFREKLHLNWSYVLLSVAFMLFTTASFAQTITVKGTITDARGGDPMIGASVTVDGTQLGVTTDIDGTFTLAGVPTSGTLTFSYIGYKSQSEAVQSGKNYAVALQEDLQALDEVVVVGYEVKKKSVVTGAISSVSADELNQAKATNAVSALTGRVSGVNVMSSSGQPGTSPQLIIRGVGTNGDSTPLYVVDGLQMSNLDNINPNDIASMEILKDATSTAIYGSRGANGVVLVTTKKGTAGRTTLTYDGYYGVSNVLKTPDMMNAEEYVYMINTFNETSGKDARISETGYDTDWFDEIFSSAPVQEHNLSFTTASDRGSALVSIGYLNQEGILGGDKSKYERITVRSNSDYKINEYIQVGANINVAHVMKNTMSTGANGWNPVNYAYNMEPTAPVYDSNSGDWAGYGVTSSGYTRAVNPVAFIDYLPDANNRSTNMQGNAFINVTPIEGLTIRSNLGTTLYYSYNNSYTEPYYHNPNNINTDGSLSTSASTGYSWLWENTINYKKSFGLHNFSLLGGTSANYSYGEWMSASRSNPDSNAATSEAWRYLSAGDVSTSTNSGDASSVHTIQSYFARLSYDYDERYMAEFVVRRDGSSNFGPNNKYGTFPGVSVGWNIHNEAFWDVNNFDTLKFRASWGQNGNENIDAFSYTSIVSSTYYYTYGDDRVITPGSAPDSMSNSDVKWETSEQLNFGLDMGFFGGKLTGSFDWYKKVTKDLLMQPTFSGVYGNTAPYYNVGQISNTGIEFMVNYRNHIGDLNYSLSANASYVKNNVDKMVTDNGYIDGAYWREGTYVTRMEVGHELGYFRLYETDGIFNTQEEIDNYVDASGNKIQPDAVPGDFKWVDHNGDGQITDDDRTDMGSGLADWTFGANITLEYKGFDLTMQLAAKTGLKTYAAQLRSEGYGVGNLPTFYLDHWSTSNTNATVPRLADSSADTNGNFIKASDFYLYDGDYLNISLLELGYSLPKRLINKARLSNVRVYVAVDNLAKFCDYPFMDSEISDMRNGSTDILETGMDYSAYPTARTTRVGVNIAF